MIKHCNGCVSKTTCTKCGLQLCTQKDEYNCFIEGHYSCPEKGIVCMDCKDSVKRELKC